MAVRTSTAPSATSAFVRTAVALQTVAIFFQAVTAGVLLSSSHGEPLHSAGARVMYGASMLYVLAAVLAWKPGGGSPRPVGYATGFLALASVQVVLGVKHVSSVHVPLGVLMFGLSVLVLGRQVPARREDG
jgi:threonine/homoserine efflux transporter RhtA